jgi:hypothetical protein
MPQTTGNSFDYVYAGLRGPTPPRRRWRVAAKAQSFYQLELSASGADPHDRALREGLEAGARRRRRFPQHDRRRRNVYGLKVKEEAEILSGDGTGVHLNGIITQATAFDTTLLSRRSVDLDSTSCGGLSSRRVSRASPRTPRAGSCCTRPTWRSLELTKDSYGHYIIGDPKTGAEVDMVWKLPVVESDSIAAGTFLVGAFNTAADLIDRQAGV